MLGFNVKPYSLAYIGYKIEVFVYLFLIHSIPFIQTTNLQTVCTVDCLKCLLFARTYLKLVTHTHNVRWKEGGRDRDKDGVSLHK